MFTPDQLIKMTITELTAAYNELPGVKPIKKFETKLKGIERYVAAAPKVLAAAPKVLAAAPKVLAAAPKVPASEKGRGVSGRCRELILQGLPNSEIWSIIQPEFNLDDSKKYYPAWNRSDMARKSKTS